MSMPFYEILVDEEEEDSGSELGEFDQHEEDDVIGEDEMEEDEVVAEYELVDNAEGLQLEVEVELNEDGEWDTGMVDVRRKPILTMDDSGNIHQMDVSSSQQTTTSPQPSTSALGPDWKDSPPLPSPVAPTYSPLSSPRLAHGSDEEEAHPVMEDWVPPWVASTPWSYPRSRGSRLRGGNTGRGRRFATKAVSGESGWRRGERIIEVCLDDDDIPQELREMLHELESARNARILQQKKRNVRVNIAKDNSDSEDEFHDAESHIVTELFNGDHSALNFQWSPMATFTVLKEKYQPKQPPGPRYKTTNAYEAFKQFWDDDILNHIVTETNRHALEIQSTSPRFAKVWHDTNIHEILIMFAFWMMLGIIRMPSIKSCFSNNILLETRIFRILMTEARYWALTRAIHLVNNATCTPDSSKSFPLGPIVDHLNKKFKEAYTLDQDITIDESLTLWKGKLSFRQYIKTKAARFGIKTFELCESATGYLWSFLIYVGKDCKATASKLPKSMEIVMQLVKPLLNIGHRLFLDNWFNSPILARFLKRHQTDCVGTLRKTRKHVPPLIQLANIPEGTCIARHSGDVVVMAYQDKKPVYTISTCHGTDSVHIKGRPSGKPPLYRPAVINDYNKGMGGVDKKDQMLEPYLIERKKCRNWYMKMFKRLLNVSILNSSILVDKSSQDQIKQTSFRLELVNEILKRHLPHVPKSRQKVCFNRSTDLNPKRSIGKHYIVRSNVSEQRTAGNSRTSKNRRCCVWCIARLNRYSKTVWRCEQCLVPLCIDGCFKMYHEAK